MDISNIIRRMPNGMQKAAIKLGKHAPDIMMYLGTGIVIGSAIHACRQTIKAADILEDAGNDLNEIDEAISLESKDYTEVDARNDRIRVYSRTALDLTKTYGASIAFGMAGIGLMLGAHKILKSRNAALAIAYSNVVSAYNIYREKVVAAIGEEKEFQLRSGYSKEEIDVVDEDGNNKHIKNAKVINQDGTELSVWARVFDEGCSSWSQNPSSNLMFLRSQQNYANDLLRSKGVVFLNEVYEALGFPRTPEGQIVGWVFDPDNADIDSYIDFGIYDKIYRSVEKRDFINGYEPCIWLDFNVDGVVYDLL